MGHKWEKRWAWVLNIYPSLIYKCLKNYQPTFVSRSYLSFASCSSLFQSFCHFDGFIGFTKIFAKNIKNIFFIVKNYFRYTNIAHSKELAEPSRITPNKRDSMLNRKTASMKSRLSYSLVNRHSALIVVFLSTRLYELLRKSYKFHI